MSDFRSKRFEGKDYHFDHLRHMGLEIPLNGTGTLKVPLYVTFGCHCFTEAFDASKHRPDHRYTHKGELRAFDVQRYECSLQLPNVIQAMQRGMIYDAKESYTYTAHIQINSATGLQNYSVFFSLEKDKRSEAPALRMFVKSAYLRNSAAVTGAQSWRFSSLAGQISGVFEKQGKKPKPEKIRKQR